MLRRVSEYCRLYLGLSFLALLCLAWGALVLPLQPLLPGRRGAALGRRVIMLGFRAYLRLLSAMAACRFDLSELETLYDEPQGLILAPNHPSLLDAVMIISRFPNVACIMKSSLMDNVLFGSGARLAQYIRNDPPLRMIKEAVREVEAGSFLLIFPEGTRTVSAPLNDIKPSIGLIAKRARVPVQTLLIETDTAFLGKGWPLLRRPAMPMRYRIRLGRRFEAPVAETGAYIAEIEEYLRNALTEAQLQPPAPAGDPEFEPALEPTLEPTLELRKRRPYA
jgi:1-acyl-sn-glycerol-3-phosphate acyltransferase